MQVDEVFDLGGSVVVLVPDRARRHGMDVEFELISGSLCPTGGRPVLDAEMRSAAPSH